MSCGSVFDTIPDDDEYSTVGDNLYLNMYNTSLRLDNKPQSKYLSIITKQYDGPYYRICPYLHTNQRFGFIGQLQ